MSQQKQSTGGSMVVKLLAAVLVVGHAPSASAMQSTERDPISAQRAGGVSTFPIAPGIVQLEFGYGFQRDDDQQTSVFVHTMPDVLLIVAVSDRFDLRVWGTGLVYQREKGSTTSQGSIEGIGDLTIGSIVHLVDQRAWFPSFGLVPSVGLPTGSKELTAHAVEPGVTLASSWDVSDGFGITWNVGWHSVAAESADAGRQDAWGTLIDFEFGLTERLELWLEHFVEYSTDPQTGMGQGGAVGFSYLLADAVNLDASTAFWFSGSVSAFTGTVGASFRWSLFR